MKEDKIFNNRFNTGDLEYEAFGKIKLHESTENEDVYEEYVEGKMQQDLHDIFTQSPYYEDYQKNRKIHKNEVANIYYYFEERIPASEEVSAIEKFTHIAEFMGIPYEVLYEHISVVHKEKLLRELDAKYHVFKRKKIQRLF